MSVRGWALGVAFSAVVAFGQEQPGGLRFETAAIKPSTLSVSRRPPARGVRFELLGTHLPELIRRAYRLETYQTITGPSWINQAYYDVFATLPEGASKSRIPEMLQALLADQLKLVLRRESRDEPVCLLTVSKTGPRLKEIPADVTPDPPIPSYGNRTIVRRTKTAQGYLTYSRLNGALRLDATKITLAELAAALGREVKLPVFDRTGLPGFYEVSLYVPGASLGTPRQRAQPAADGVTSSADEEAIVPTAADPEGVNIYNSIQRLGLKLERTKLPIEHIGVVSAERIPVDFPH